MYLSFTLFGLRVLERNDFVQFVNVADPFFGSCTQSAWKKSPASVARIHWPSTSLVCKLYLQPFQIWKSD